MRTSTQQISSAHVQQILNNELLAMDLDDEGNDWGRDYDYESFDYPVELQELDAMASRKPARLRFSPETDEYRPEDWRTFREEFSQNLQFSA